MSIEKNGKKLQDKKILSNGLLENNDDRERMTSAIDRRQHRFSASIRMNFSSIAAIFFLSQFS